MESELSALERFDAAVIRGEDPVNAEGTAVKVTTVDSEWAMRSCRGCGHTFRLEDVVQATYDASGKVRVREVRHTDSVLGCASGTGQADAVLAEPDPMVQRFQAAADAVDPPPAFPVLTRLTATHPLVADKPTRDQCPECTSTLRPGEMVVICPCDKGCQRAIHQDASRGLTCFDGMLAQHKRIICPMTKQPKDA
ncbi:hypothetical protein Rhe02_89510 [Rhizocola hellebori]|uniref:Uncharacterized protein n=1 Tax=Rhizocola hellebori TaxID=1392758 RepID=A0A8J3VKW0_9ACTN|nr:hypothetical protein [Rhizocola hellebori]GIH10884.1 hypothetical protein Rhe02_89510 [Rhizocola hellebori]